MATKWAAQAERGSAFLIWLSAMLYRLFGRTVSLAIISPAILYFYLTGTSQRAASAAWLKRAWEQGWLAERPGIVSGVRHYFSFAGALLDKLASWTGKIKPGNVDGADGETFAAAKSAGGALILTAHLGNPDLVRAVATMSRRFRVTVLMDTANAEQFNRVLNHFSEESTVRLVQVTNIDMSIAMQLSAAIERGEWVVMAADRAPPHGEAPVLMADFMGEKAAFPAGPYILASALKCPVYFLACLRTGRDSFKLVFEHFSEPVRLVRKQREEAMQALAQKFANLLEKTAAKAPYQWFNFYDFWEQPASVASAGDRVSKTEDSSV